MYMDDEEGQALFNRETNARVRLDRSRQAVGGTSLWCKELKCVCGVWRPFCVCIVSRVYFEKGRDTRGLW